MLSPLASLFHWSPRFTRAPLTSSDTVAHTDVFRHHLALSYPVYGHALWEPDPGNLYPAVEIGDVGYIHRGKFRRFFNVLLPENHPSHRNFGVPEYHEPLTLSIEDHIEIGRLSPHNFCSARVTSGPELDRWADGPRKEGEVSFSCPMNQGAVICLPMQATGKDTVASADFGRWIVKHIDCWFAWARERGLRVDRMEDVILVTGTHRTRSCTNVAFPGGRRDAQVSLRPKVGQRDDRFSINWEFSDQRNRGAVLNRGPDGEDLPEDQCIFIRGFRVTRKLKILPPKLMGAAGPNPGPEEYDEEPDAELTLISDMPKYRDPLHKLLDYIAEEAPSNCDMILVHDDDLARLGGIHGTPIDADQPDVMLNHIRSLKPRIHSARIVLDPSSSYDSASANTECAWVATLSNVFEQPPPPSPPPSLLLYSVPLTTDRVPAGHAHPEGRYGDSSDKLFRSYLSKADRDQLQSWKSDTEKIYMFTCLFFGMAVVFIIESYMRLQPDSSETTTVLLLAQILQLLAAHSNVTSLAVPSTLPSQAFRPTASAVHVDVLWFLSMTLGLLCALLAALTRQCVEHYLQRWDAPCKPMPERTLFAKVIERIGLPRTIESLEALLYAYMLLFFAGMVDFLVDIDDKSAVPLFSTILMVTLALAYFLSKVLPVRAPMRTQAKFAAEVSKR